MARWLDTLGQPNLGIGICGRCSRKFPLAMLQRDANTPGLLVCEADNDGIDPYRFPMAQTSENMALPFVRPDVSIATNPAGLISQDGDVFLITEDGEDYIKP